MTSSSPVVARRADLSVADPWTVPEEELTRGRP
jgi:hypothetical protein